MAIRIQQSVDSTKTKRYKVRTRHVQINIDLDRIDNNIKKAQTYLDASVIKDSNPYAPILTGNMRASAIEKTNIGNGEVVWQTAYAKEQYYNNKNKKKWFETAKSVHLKKWTKNVKEISGKR